MVFAPESWPPLGLICWTTLRMCYPCGANFGPGPIASRIVHTTTPEGRHFVVILRGVLFPHGRLYPTTLDSSDQSWQAEQTGLIRLCRESIQVVKLRSCSCTNFPSKSSIYGLLTSGPFSGEGQRGWDSDRHWLKRLVWYCHCTNLPRYHGQSLRFSPYLLLTTVVGLLTNPPPFVSARKNY
jgi:hypothetical protein